VGQRATLKITLRNGSSQTYADVTLRGAVVDSCFDTSGPSYDVGPLTSGARQTWLCHPLANVTGGYMYADGDPTDSQLAEASNVDSQINLDTSAFEADVSSPRVADTASSSQLTTSFGSAPPNGASQPLPAVSVVVAGQQTTFKWELKNIGAVSARPAYAIKAVGPESTSAETLCQGQGARVAPRHSTTISCPITLAIPGVARLTLEARDAHARKSLVISQSDEVTVVAADAHPPPPRRLEPILVTRTVETYPKSGRYGAVGYGSTATMIRITNGFSPTSSVVVTDSSPSCSRSLGRLAPGRIVTYRCQTAAAPDPTSSGLPATTSHTLLTGVVAGGFVDATDTTKIFVDPPVAASAAPTDTSKLSVSSVLKSVSRHFVLGVLIIAALGAGLIIYEQLVVQPGSANIGGDADEDQTDETDRVMRDGN
jgi:hypothetical protein